MRNGADRESVCKTWGKDRGVHPCCMSTRASEREKKRPLNRQERHRERLKMHPRMSTRSRKGESALDDRERENQYWMSKRNCLVQLGGGGAMGV